MLCYLKTRIITNCCCCFFGFIFFFSFIPFTSSFLSYKFLLSVHKTYMCLQIFIPTYNIVMLYYTRQDKCIYKYFQFTWIYLDKLRSNQLNPSLIETDTFPCPFHLSPRHLYTELLPLRAQGFNLVRKKSSDGLKKKKKN